MRHLARTDLFFLFIYILKRHDADNDWVFERCRDVNENPDNMMDLWFREGYKSSIITHAKTIQDILIDPEITVGIFSFNRPIAKGFLRGIMRELETNDELRNLFPDVLYMNPRKESPKWSEDEGVIVKRRGNMRESTIEAWGLVDGQPTSKHFKLRVYDDCETRDNVSTPEMLNKTFEAWEQSLNLGTRGGRARYIGTIWHYDGLNTRVMKRGSVTPRIFKATKDGSIDGEPWLWTREELRKKIEEMGPRTSSAQLFMEAIVDNTQGFKAQWVRYYDNVNPADFNVYIVVDPANDKKKGSDYTVMWVIGLGSDLNYYLLGGIRERLNLTERAETLFSLYQHWKPIVIGYEQYGMQSDVQHIRFVQEQRNYRFGILPIGGTTSKVDRVQRLVPVFENGRFYFPKKMLYTTREGVTIDLIDHMIQDELLKFPFCAHDDMLDCLARIVDPKFPVAFPQARLQYEETTDYDTLRSRL